MNILELLEELDENGLVISDWDAIKDYLHASNISTVDDLPEIPISNIPVFDPHSISDFDPEDWEDDSTDLEWNSDLGEWEDDDDIEDPFLCEE